MRLLLELRPCGCKTPKASLIRWLCYIGCCWHPSGEFKNKDAALVKPQRDGINLKAGWWWFLELASVLVSTRSGCHVHVLYARILRISAVVLVLRLGIWNLKA